MDTQIKEIINLLASKIRNKLPKDIRKLYYQKMSYSNVNTIMKLNKELLNKNISFEIAFIHIIAYIFVKNNNIFINDYISLLKKLDNDRLFSWYEIDKDFIEEHLNSIDINKYTNIYSFINLHDTLIDKEIKKKFGQFYTPTYIVKKMVNEIKANIKVITMDQKVSDPACGTGVFLVEVLNILNLKFSLNQKFEYLNNNIYAYDVNPFAIVATKLNLIYVLTLQHMNETNELVNMILKSEELFKNIQWRNTIVEKDENNYAIIIGNPPYFKLNNLLMKELDSYKEISFGQTNIYSLFMFWAIRHLEEDGIMCFIVPQSIRSGLYFKNLRTKMSDLRIRTMIQIESRQNIFDRAEQAVSIICLENKKVGNTKTKIQFYEGSNDKISSEFKVSRSRLMMDESFNSIFIISKKIQMYDILEKVYKNSERLDSKTRNLKFCNGLFVWNQHKEDIVEYDKNTVPIIYGGNVQRLKFDFQQCSSNKERKQYSNLNKRTSKYIVEGKRLLVQRTTNFDKKIRIKSCIISDEFLIRYKKYFLENHINYLCLKNDKNEILDKDSLFYYLGILNSKLLNYIFISKSGNTQVSANELNSLPFPIKNSKKISNFVREHIQDMDQYQDELDSMVCQIYGLSEVETDFIIRY